MQTAFALAPEMELQYPASKVCNRFQLIGPDGLFDYRFLSQWWALFGMPPATTYEGFVYQIIHLESGIVFQAYSGASGPAYCFSDIHKEKAKLIINSLEELLIESRII